MTSALDKIVKNTEENASKPPVVNEKKVRKQKNNDLKWWAYHKSGANSAVIDDVIAHYGELADVEVELDEYAILCGELGTGKTTYAMAYLTSKKAEGFDVAFLDCKKLSLKTDINEAKAMVANCINKKYVVIDDPGMIKGLNYLTTIVGNMIVDRIENRLSTVLTMNENMSDIFDERIIDKSRVKLKKFSMNSVVRQIRE